MPGHPKTHLPPESYAPADRNNFIGRHCSPTGIVEGHYYYNVEKPSLIPYIVDSKTARKDAVVVIAPGGGNDHLAFDVTGLDLAEWLNSIGISAFVLKYRVPATAWDENFHVSDMDLQRAMSIVRDWATKNEISPYHVGLLGSSAGGGLAARLLELKSRSYKKIDEIDNLSYWPNFMILMYPGIHQWTFKFDHPPPMFIAMAVDDPCVKVENVINYYKAVKDHNGSPSELHIYPDGRHGYGRCTMYPSWKHHKVCKWTERAEVWLAQLLHINFTRQVTWRNSTWCPPEVNNLFACNLGSQCVGHCDVKCWERCGKR